MPGVIIMENGGPNGERTDHDRAAGTNGINGAAGGNKPHSASGNGKAPADGGEVVSASSQPPAQTEKSSIQLPLRMNDLPDEIVHITQGFVPLSLLLSRLAQTSHNSIQDKVAELAKMPLPAAAVNGNSAHTSTSPDDSSNENLRKKAAILLFTQDMHAKWVKALVITEWSRKADMVSKLIDLKFDIDEQRKMYDAALENIANVKRDLTFARMPPPDLKTALQVLSTGEAPWLPDLQYIEPPPLTLDEQVKWTNDLDTLLSLRLNLEDYDKIPHHFKDYEIGSGRVTFKVPGEFEVDLTIADEDFEKQFWFIDFRFCFNPSPSSLPETLRAYVEGCVNEALEKDGLTGCYQFLHEFVLTFKINEIKRQALQLSRSAWSGTLMVEPLHRALAIQYWTSRSQVTGSKNWVLLAIHNRPKQNGRVDPKSSSYIVATWYRDNKEVSDVKIALDTENLSAENLLRTVVGQHIEHVLTSIRDKLQATPRFKNREAGMSLHISRTDPGASFVDTQVGFNGRVSLLMEPTTGAFAVKPHSKFAIHYEHQLNHGKSPAEDGMQCLENVRCGITDDQINRRGSCMGWSTRKAPVGNELLKSILKVREWTRTIWLQKGGWGQDWYVAVLLGLGGDEWWVVQTSRDDTSRSLKSYNRLPLSKGHPDLSDAFWDNLTLFATGMIAQATDLQELHRHRIKSKQVPCSNMSLPQEVRLPYICFTLSAFFPSMGMDSGEAVDARSLDDAPADSVTVKQPKLDSTRKQHWAHDQVAIEFKGIQPARPQPGSTDAGSIDRNIICMSDALISVRQRSKFTSLNGKIDSDVFYNPAKGEFRLRIRHAVGEPVLATVKSRVKAIDRFVNFLESLDKVKAALTNETMTLKRVSFTYGESRDAASEEASEQEPQRWRVVLDLSKDEIDIEFEKSNPHLRVVDLSKRLVNSSGGIAALMNWLPSSLPIAMAIDKMESAWDSIHADGRGSLDLSMKAMDWMSMQYTLPGTANTKRELKLEVKLKTRKGEPWWHLFRSDAPENTAIDEFNEILKPIWTTKGAKWNGLRTSAAGRPDVGVVNMLQAVDDAMQALAAQPAMQQQSKKPQGQTGASDVVVLDD